MSDFVDPGRRRFIRAALVAPVIPGCRIPDRLGQNGPPRSPRDGLRPGSAREPHPRVHRRGRAHARRDQGPFFKPARRCARSSSPGFTARTSSSRGEVFSTRVPSNSQCAARLLARRRRRGSTTIRDSTCAATSSPTTRVAIGWRPSFRALSGTHAPFPREGQAAHGACSTTQLYFPGEARNERDGLFGPIC